MKLNDAYLYEFMVTKLLANDLLPAFLGVVKLEERKNMGTLGMADLAHQLTFFKYYLGVRYVYVIYREIYAGTADKAIELLPQLFSILILLEVNEYSSITRFATHMVNMLVEHEELVSLELLTPSQVNELISVLTSFRTKTFTPVIDMT
jgi:hypothetical protein